MGSGDLAQVQINKAHIKNTQVLIKAYSTLLHVDSAKICCSILN